MLQAVSKFEKGGAIALINYYQDTDGKPLNPEKINLEITRKSPVPVFMESETLLGKGIAGGIFIRGRAHGRDAASLALKFIDISHFVPQNRIALPENRYYFDYNVLKKFSINEKDLPSGSRIINKPQALFLKYLKYFVALLVIIGLLIMIVLILLFNINRRKKAESLVNQNLGEIKEKNSMLQEAHDQVREMNVELEEINEHLSKTNEELNQARKKSEESDRLKSAFLANMSHEIRTPLNAIVGFSSLLSDPDLKHSDRESYFHIISANSNQLLNIIEDILDLSKIEAGQLKTYIEIFSVNEMLNELFESFYKTHHSEEVKLKLSIPDRKKMVMLRTDPARLKQILTNLLSNALKFTKKGSIEIGYKLTNEKDITFYVMDTGKGINASDLSNIFNRFWKGENQDEDFHTGTGLGLSICKSLCDFLGGKIWAESILGQGSTFFVTLQDYQIRKEMHPAHEVHIPDFFKYDWSRITIAIAEDESSNLYLLTRILNNLNVNIISFRNGRELVDFINNHASTKIDLILMDLKMPIMDGYAATRIIRELNPKIPIIAQTAYAMVEDIEKIKAASFDDYMVKPIKANLLVEKIKRLIFPETN
jgi:signal transduction histidine kinase/CheY-like chemotaxis protein